MKKIIAIIGPSGSGKTHASMFLKDHFGVPSIVSYTTRQIRPWEENGREHWFVSELQMPPKNRMLAYTLFGGQHYWASLDQLSEDNYTTYVVDEAGYKCLLRINNQIEVIGVYIDCPEQIIFKSGVDKARIKRDKHRKKLPKSYYDYIITRDSTTEDFEAKLTKLIKKIWNKTK